MYNYKIAWLSLFWMFGIVLFHCGGSVQSSWYSAILSDFRIGGVSFFFIVSGYFLVKKYDENKALEWWKVSLNKRVKTLLIPYFLWCLMGGGYSNPLAGFGLTALGPTADPPLWYVKFLLIFCVISPILIYVTRRLSYRVYWISFAVVLLVSTFLSLPLKFSLVLSLFAFSFGMALRFHRLQMPRSIYVPVALGAVWLGLMCLRSTVPNIPLVFDWPIKVASALSLLSFTYIVLDRSVIAIRLPDCLMVTFFIFCSHGIVLRYVQPLSSFTPIGAFSNGVIVFALSCALANLVKKISNMAYSLLTGGR